MKKIVVIGYPVKHSLSPAMHNAALKHIGLEKEFIYEKMEIKPGLVKEFTKKIRLGKIVGANVTIPHKIEMFNSVDKRTKEAELIGSVNTVYMCGGELWGHCTDGIGCINSLKENEVSIENKKIVIVGSGGAARAIAFTLALNKVEEILIINKTVLNAKILADEIGEKTSTLIKCTGLDSLGTSLKGADILIHCTPVGMKHKAEGQTLITKDMLHNRLVVMDIVYNPLKTKLLEEAEKAGCKIITGEGMLVHQGVVGFELWTGKKAPIEVMRMALLNALGESK